LAAHLGGGLRHEAPAGRVKGGNHKEASRLSANHLHNALPGRKVREGGREGRREGEREKSEKRGRGRER